MTTYNFVMENLKSIQNNEILTLILNRNELEFQIYDYKGLNVVIVYIVDRDTKKSIYECKISVNDEIFEDLDFYEQLLYKNYIMNINSLILTIASLEIIRENKNCIKGR